MQEDFDFIMSYTVESDKSLILDSVTKYLSCTWSFPTCQYYLEFSLMLQPLQHCLIIQLSSCYAKRQCWSDRL